MKVPKSTLYGFFVGCELFNINFEGKKGKIKELDLFSKDLLNKLMTDIVYRLFTESHKQWYYECSKLPMHSEELCMLHDVQHCKNWSQWFWYVCSSTVSFFWWRKAFSVLLT